MKAITLRVILVLLSFPLINPLIAQVGINADGSAPHSSAMLDVKSNVKGLLIPRMTSAERAALGASATAGLMVYDTDLDLFFFHDGTAWEEGATGNLWLTDGNNIFQDDLNDSVGIGTVNPQRKFETFGNSNIARLSSTSANSFLEFTGTSATDWAVGISGNSFKLISSADNFNTSADEFFFTQPSFYPAIDNTTTLGTNAKQWSSVYGVKGHFSDNVIIGTNITLGKLHVHDGASSNNMIYITPASGGSGDSSAVFLAEDSDASFGMYWLYDGGENHMELWGKSYSTLYGPHLLVDRNTGEMAIGNTLANGYRLSVDGKIICTELRVNLVADWPDYVLQKDYKLMPLQDLRAFIEENGHLPNVPPACEIESAGMDIGAMQKRMMEKIEELSLYILQQQEEIDALKVRLDKEKR